VEAEVDNAAYQYRIQACQPVGKGGVVCSVFSAPISVQVQITGGLTPPTSMQCRFTITSGAVFNCDSSVAGSSLIDSGTDYSVQWTAVSGATRYELCEEAGGGGGSCTSETTLSKTLRKPNSNIGSFTYAVRACNALGCSALFAPSMPVTVRCRPQQNCGNLRAPPVVTYVHTDQLGSPIAETDSTGSLSTIKRFRYEPYGKSLETNPLQGPSYTGHVYDQSSGLIYMQQRYYDPMIGRFLSTDPAAVDGMGFNFNRYAYAANNPYKYVDPDGRVAILIPLFEAAAACVESTLCLAATATTAIATGAAINNSYKHTSMSGRYFSQSSSASNAKSGSEETGSDSSSDDGELHMPGDVPNGRIIVRGGQGPLPAPGDVVSGSQGETIEDAAKGVPHGSVRVTTAGEIRAGGGSVEVLPEVNPKSGNVNGNHVDIVTGENGTGLGEIIPNPVPKKDRFN
jgi:RHS repeat-associated protein